ncbi:TetR/AcrR family transcriptional regulator [Oscillatoria sp. CS-180]|uniref:TetR/AcrR family transcriptional regulator n=1 Tax=Oscillatoria sp. CS-180 TaxID=3021720 RepID=UPI00232FAB22|nr:TetR/AcrR family transcriptional regulator [Oscillatoria sp. CS-180]MDB9524976.1 TetR/AcrR family transcriptional regulator [Oscillatoria sp. CS-180]
MTRGPSKQFDTEVALTKAMEVFAAHGYEAASLSQLLKHMGIGKKSLYDTFGNKQSLFLKALDHYAQTTVRTVRKRLSADGSPLENLTFLLKDLQQMHSQPDSCGCMLGTNIADFDTSDEEIATVMRTYSKQIEDAFTATLVRAQAEGEITPSAQPRALARMLLCTTQGLALLSRIMDDNTVLEEAIAATIELLDKS